jgi:hypothetical protein
MVSPSVIHRWARPVLWAVGLLSVVLLVAGAAVVGAYFGNQPEPPYAVFEATPVGGGALVEFVTANQSIGQVCAGEMITQTLGIRIREPAIIKGYIGFRDVTKNEAVPPNTVQFAIPRSEAGASVDTIHWQVPEYQPGQFVRIVGTTTERPSLPAFFITAFEVVPCP